MKGIKHDLLHVVGRFESLSGHQFGMDYRGNRCVTMDADEFNGVQVPQARPGSLVFDIELLLDRTSLEAFCQQGRVVFAEQLKPPVKEEWLRIVGEPAGMRIHTLKVFELESIWPQVP